MCVPIVNLTSAHHSIGAFYTLPSARPLFTNIISICIYPLNILCAIFTSDLWFIYFFTRTFLSLHSIFSKRSVKRENKFPHSLPAAHSLSLALVDTNFVHEDILPWKYSNSRKMELNFEHCEYIYERIRAKNSPTLFHI